MIRRLRQRLNQRMMDFQFRRLAAGEPITFNAGQMYGLPSGEGMIFVSIAFVMLLTSSTYSNNLLFAMSFLAAALFFLLPTFVFRNIKGCSFSFAKMTPIFLGEKANCPITIGNPGKSWGLAIHVEGGSDTPIAKVERSISVNLSFSPQRRGYQPFPPVRISSAYPMGLFNLWGWMKNPQQVLVYPRPAGQPLETFFRLNDQKAKFSADTDLEYWQHRDFQPGDSYSRVDWVRLATDGKMYIREYRPTGDATLRFDLERTAMSASSLEERISQLCLWLCQAEERGLRYSLTIKSQHIPVDKGPGQLHSCLEALACHEPGSSSNTPQ